MPDHEKLDVYQCSIEFLALSVQIIETLPRGNSALVDQLKRASWSIPLNIAEGCGKTSSFRQASILRDWSRILYGMWCDSRCSESFEDHSVSLFDKGKQLLHRIVAMLTKMCQRSH